MDLKSFVAETLVQIVEGVADAQKRIAELNVGAAVNAQYVHPGSRQIANPRPVEFDVAVTVSDESAAKAGLGASAGFLSVISAKIDGKAETSDTLRNEAVSRIQFSVNISQPADLNVGR